MSLSITIDKGEVPAPQLVSPFTVTSRAGDSRAVGLCDPSLKFDLSGLHFTAVSDGSKGVEMVFDHGTIAFTLSQQVLLSNQLSSVAQRKWAEHEQHHVDDNRDCMDSLEAEFLGRDTSGKIFVLKNHFYRSELEEIKKQVRQEIRDSFSTLTADRVALEDTKEEYQRVWRAILREDPNPLIHTVVQGETLEGLSRFYYGASNKKKKIRDANKSELPNGNSRIRAGMKLTIPK